jgi:ketosteroid isomerase-like protein
MTREEIVSLFSGRAVAQGDHDVDGLTSLYAESCVVESPLGGTHQGRDAIAQVLRTFFDAFPDAELSQEDLIIDGDHVVRLVPCRARTQEVSWAWRRAAGLRSCRW